MFVKNYNHLKFPAFKHLDLRMIICSNNPKSTQWYECFLYVALIITAGVMRLWDLGSRTLHHDESLHAFFSWVLYEGGGYSHEPITHGPLQFHANAAVFTLFGDSDYTTRILYALVGTILVALPYFMRNRLGRVGALLVSVMLTFSPTLLYFSRFARNDILIGSLTLAIVIVMWRYIDESKNKYLYISAGLLALIFSTKETAYLISVVLGTFLLIAMISKRWNKENYGPYVGNVSPPVALSRLTYRIWHTIINGLRPSSGLNSAKYFVLIISLTLPLWAASFSLVQNLPLLKSMDLVLANPLNTSPIGVAIGEGLIVAICIMTILMLISVYWGFKWSWHVWWRAAIIFYLPWILLHTTFFTNLSGINSGMWQSLGYWIVQQGEARGEQPFYYYLVLTSIYEFMPFLFSILASIYYIRKKDRFGCFLSYWIIVSFLLYTLASEKMPWLLVNLTIPMVVMSGKFLADIFHRLQLDKLARTGELLTIPIILLSMLFLWKLIMFQGENISVVDIVSLITIGAILFGLLLVLTLIAKQYGFKNITALSILTLALILFITTIRTGMIVNYRNDEIPVEMLIYTQSSPDITEVIENIKQVEKVTGKRNNTPIIIDDTSGFAWPWVWYLRNYDQVSYPMYDKSPLNQDPDSSVILVHSQNKIQADAILTDSYSEGILVKHRWWFPENTYRDYSIIKFLRTLTKLNAWQEIAGYFIHRDGVVGQIGSEDAYVYYSKEFQENLLNSE